MDDLREKLLGFLAAGASQTVAASAAGCSDGYVSQLLQEDSFRDQLALRRAARLTDDVKHDETLAAAEDLALKTVRQKLPYVRSPLEAARIYQILNNANRRVQEGSGAVGAEGVDQVTIVLPRAAKARIQLNSSNQVIEVEGRSMATLPSRNLPQLAQEIREKDKKRASDVLENVRSVPVETMIGGVVRVL